MSTTVAEIFLLFPLLFNVLSLLPLLIGAFILPSTFGLSRILILTGVFLTAVSFVEDLVVIGVTSGEYGFDPQDMSGNIAKISMVFGIMRIAGVVLIGSGVWKLAAEVRNLVSKS